MSSPEPLSIAIVGGGIGGLCLAIGLLQNPHLRVSVYEAASAFADIGAGVALGPNAQRALALISPAAENAFLSEATTSLSPEFANVWFDFRCGMAGPRDGEELGAIKNDTGQQTVHRARFLDRLAQLIPAEVAHFGKRLEKVEELGSGEGVKMSFADGSTANADAVMGADGIHSAVRRSLLGDSHPAACPVFAGSIAYRGLVPIEIARRQLGEVADNSFMWCGEEGMVMNYPIDHGQTLNVVACRSGKTKWEYPGQSVVQVTKEQLLDDYAAWGEVPRRILELIEKPTLWQMMDDPAAPYFHSGNIAIIGDAAHATTPYQGAGAGQAIEDAATLSALFSHVRKTEQIAPALAAYDAVRRPRSQKVVVTSREALRLYCFNDGVVNGNARLWKKTWDERMEWLWSADLVRQNELAVLEYTKTVSGPWIQDEHEESPTEAISGQHFREASFRTLQSLILSSIIIGIGIPAYLLSKAKISLKALIGI